jgi:hypothetical protein
MSNQEMQFADPDWRPSQQLNPINDQQEQETYTPQPINNEFREQNKWNSSPYATPQQQEGYNGLRPYNTPIPGQMQGGMYRQRSYRRRGRGLWFWLILAFIIFSLIGGGSRFSRGFSTGYGPGFNQGPVDQGPVMAKPFVTSVNGQANVVINDLNGNVTVTEGQTNNQVIIQPIDGNGFPGSNGNQQAISQNGNTITADISNPQDLQVTVPEGTNLNLNTGTGNIIFNGTFPATGTTQFQTTSGDITVTVQSTSAFHIDASTNSGSITSEFPNLNIQDNASGGQNVNGMVGGNSKGPAPNVIIQSDSGNISLNSR